jgi:hypothetical protein
MAAGQRKVVVVVVVVAIALDTPVQEGSKLVDHVKVSLRTYRISDAGLCLSGIARRTMRRVAARGVRDMLF